MAKQKGDANLNNLRKQLDQIVGELQTIQRNITAMREAGKSAKQIYKEYGKELEKLQANEEALNALIEERKELTKSQGDVFKKYIALKNASDREQRKITKQLSDLEDKAYKRSEKSRQSGLKNERSKQKEIQKLKDRNYLDDVRGSNMTTKTKLRLELDYLNKMQRRYRKSSTEYLDIENQKTKALQKALRDRDSIIKKYRKSRPKENDTKSSGFLGGLQKGFSTSELGRSIGRITGVGTAVDLFRRILNGVKQALLGSFKAAVDFEAQLAQLQAVTGINNQELARLEKNVLNVAGSTKFTSEQIVELQTELGKLGFSVDDIEQSTLAVANTAQALGEKVGPVAQKIGQILKQYNLQASETTKVSDTLVSVINSSALSFEGFGTALQYIGPLGAEVGTTFQETSAAMAILADNGFTASRIGTGLRGILTELSTTGDDLITVVEKLAKEELSLSEAVDLVGKRNAAQLITLVDNVEELAKAEEKYYNVGSAAIASAQQIDTYAGNLDLLKSAFNRVQIEFGNFIKNSSLLKAALKLLDRQGYETALAMEFLSSVDPQQFSDDLKAASEEAVKLVEKGGEFANRQQIYAEQAAKIYKDVLSPLQRQYVENEERIAEIIEEQGEAAGRQKRLGTEKAQQLQDELKRLRELQEENSDYKVTSEEILAIQKSLTGQIKEQSDLLRITNARNKIEEEYAKTLEGYKDRRKDENRDLADSLKLRKEIEEKEAEIKVQRDAQQAIVDEQQDKVEKLADSPKEVLAIAKETLRVEQAKLDQYNQEIDNLVNTSITKEELLALAQKEYEVEFTNLRNSAEERKQKLKAEQDFIDLQIKTNQNEIENLSAQIKNTNSKKKRLALEERQKNLITNQTELEKERNNLQAEANEDVQKYLDDVEKTLQDSRTLWEEAGFSDETIRVLDKADERLKKIRLSLSDLELDFPEAVDSADNLVKSLQDRFAKKLKKGQFLSEEDKNEVNKAIADMFAGMNLSEDEMQKISDYIFSNLAPSSESKNELIDKTKKLIDDIFGGIADAANDYNQVALENTVNRLNQEIDAIKQRYKLEEEILKSQLDNQLITENQFRLKQKELLKAQIAEENTINRQIFESEKKADLQNVAIETTEALLSNILNNYENFSFEKAGILSILAAALIPATGAAKADAIRRRQFYPKKFEEGGVVQGPSHSEGGVPFTVQGRGGYEMEGGEFIVNKRATSLHRGLLEKINSSYKVPAPTSQYKFAAGGFVGAVTGITSMSYLEVIAENTEKMANNTSKPVRAYIADKDLRSNATERTIRDRNDRL